jgi:hypothetical protein
MRGLDPRFHRPRRKRDHQSAAVERQRVESSCASSSRTLADNLGAAVTRCPPQYRKAPHQLLAFVRRCQAPPKRGQQCPRVCWRRIRHRSLRGLALSLPAAEPIECLVAMGDNAITTVNRVKDRALPLRHGAASRYVRIPEPPGGPRRHRHNRASIRGALSDRTAPICRQGPN